MTALVIAEHENAHLRPATLNTITAAATPALASGNNISSTTLTGWNTAVAAKDVIGINLKVVATATYVNLTVGCS